MDPIALIFLVKTAAVEHQAEATLADAALALGLVLPILYASQPKANVVELREEHLRPQSLGKTGNR
jgi:hypothetical protein